VALVTPLIFLEWSRYKREGGTALATTATKGAEENGKGMGRN